MWNNNAKNIANNLTKGAKTMARGGRRRTTWARKPIKKGGVRRVKKIAVKTLNDIRKLKPRIRRSSKQKTNTRYAGRIAKKVYVYKVKVI